MANEFLLDIEVSLNKNLYIEKPNIHLENEDFSDYINKDNPIPDKKRLLSLPIMSSNYLLCLPEIKIKEKEKSEKKNVIENEEIFKINDNLPKLDENKQFKFDIPHEFALPLSLIKSSLNQQPEKIKKEAKENPIDEHIPSGEELKDKNIEDSKEVKPDPQKEINK